MTVVELRLAVMRNIPAYNSMVYASSVNAVLTFLLLLSQFLVNVV